MPNPQTGVRVRRQPTDRPFDFIGTPIRVGDVIVYGAALGHSAALDEGEVVGISRRSSSFGSDWAIRVRKGPVIDARWATDDGQWQPNAVEEWGRVQPRDVTLYFPERLYVTGQSAEAFRQRKETEVQAELSRLNARQ